jgi:hypothetical protein
MDKKIKKGQVRMGKGMCKKWVVTLKTENSNENQICQ